MRRIAAAGVLVTMAMVTAAPAGAAGQLTFSGRQWVVKSGSARMGPGPNFFGAGNSFVDAGGRLHLRISQVNGRWQCAEVLAVDHLGYGTYTWVVASRIDILDPNAVLGLFTWSDNAAYNHREIDFEASRWSKPADPTSGQFVVQPWSTTGNLQRTTLAPSPSTTITMTWAADRVTVSASGASPASWTYTGPDTPVPGDEVVHMNLWLNGGKAPASRKAVEVVLSSFTYTP